MTEEIASLSLTGRIVLLSVTALEADGETPAHTGEVVRASSDHVGNVEAETVGKLSEAEVNRTLNTLEDASLVDTAARDDTSPVGKGRPAYRLDVDAGEVLDALDEDEDVGALVDRIAAHQQ